jgi:hypothetical protein
MSNDVAPRPRHDVVKQLGESALTLRRTAQTQSMNLATGGQCKNGHSTMKPPRSFSDRVEMALSNQRPVCHERSISDQSVISQMPAAQSNP